MNDKGQKRRKSKSWYRKQAFCNKRTKTDGTPGHRLVAGLKGFIITCNDHERDAVKESYNILNEYAEKLYGPETKEEAEGSGDNDVDDIETAFAKEVQNLKDVDAKGERRFQNSLTGAKNCIFIKTTLDDPVELAHAIFTDLLQTQNQKSKYALRLLPVVGTCKANLKEITALAQVVLEPFFKELKHEVTYVINFKARNNNGIGREMTISSLRNTITDTFSSALLRYTPANPYITVLVEVMCGIACIAVAKEFAHFRKYNLLEVVHEKQIPSQTQVTDNKEFVSVQKTLDAKVIEDKMCNQQHLDTTDLENKSDICKTDTDSPLTRKVQDPNAVFSSQVENYLLPTSSQNQYPDTNADSQETLQCERKVTEQEASLSSQGDSSLCTTLIHRA